MPTPFPTDWNVYLRGLGQPAEPGMEPIPDPMASFRMPSDPSVRPEQIGQAIDFMYGLHKRRQEAQAAAMRYSGMQEFQQLRNQFTTGGDTPEEATRKALLGASGKLYYNKPESLPSLLRAAQPRGVPGKVMPVTAGGRTVAYWFAGPDGTWHLRQNPSAGYDQKTAVDQLNKEIKDIASTIAYETKAASVGALDAEGQKRLNDARAQITAKRQAILAISRGEQVPDYYGGTTTGTEGGESFPMPEQIEAPAAAPAARAPAPPTVKAPPGRVALRRKSDGKIVYYPASRRSEVPKDVYDILP